MATVPATAKKPADRQAKKNEAAPDEAKPVTVTHEGNDYTFDFDVFDDVETLEALEDNNLTTALRRVIGQEQYEAWKEASRNDAGRIPLDAAQTLLAALMEAAEQGN